ncbi:hypothetical protein [Planotetraspora phitsanulokensis]|uniref:hypothetical protein n=1 Tax=Planotetraspora phitsanulokensis TaxID=575192 RepID=UPI0019509698|nr:hypothetical protein [Planotetraspora phitsanulokensis]
MLLAGFVTELEHARGVIGERAEMVRRIFAANGVPAASLDPVGEAERWIDENLPELRRRHQMANGIARLPGWNPGAPGGLLPYEEQAILPGAEARRLGRQLASDLLDIDPDAFFDLALNDKYAEIVERLAGHVHDPEFTAAFFAFLGPRLTLDLPRRLRKALQEGEETALATVSRALGTAVGGASDMAGFSAVLDALGTRAQSAEDQKAVGDLLSAGRFPTEWLAKVVATQVFPPDDTLLASALTPYLNALARDPEAARLALSLATRDSPRPRDVPRFPLLARPGFLSADGRPDLATLLKDLSGRASEDASSSDAFGRLLASASGAYDESDGEHSDVAARFAFMVIAGVDDLEIAPPARIHLAEIAGAYATEITEGANLGDDNQLLPSSFGAMTSRIPGLNPAFRLSPEDTYRFIAAFAGTAADRRPFDDGMGNFTRRLIDENVPIMIRSKDPSHLDDVFAALGNVRGFELAAAEKSARAMDEATAEASDDASFALGTTLGLAGVGVPAGLAGAMFWTLLSTGVSASDTYKPDAQSEVGKIADTDNLETLGRQHTIVGAMMDAGFAPRVSPEEYDTDHSLGIADGSGRLRPFAEIARAGENSLRSLDQWFIANGMGTGDKQSLGESASDFATVFEGRKTRARSRALTFD